MKQITVYIILVSFILSIVSFIIGIKTDVSLGDEPFHYQYAADWAKKGERPVYAENMHTIEGVYYRVYENAPFWHFLTSRLIRLFPGLNPQWIGQLIQATFYFFLIVGVYFCGVELFGLKSGLVGFLLCSTLPMFQAFSIIYMMDLPVAALSAWILYFILKKDIFFAGLLFGAAIVTKRNAYFLYPLFIMIIMLYKSRTVRDIFVSKKIKEALIFTVLGVLFFQINHLSLALVKQRFNVAMLKKDIGSYAEEKLVYMNPTSIFEENIGESIIETGKNWIGKNKSRVYAFSDPYRNPEVLITFLGLSGWLIIIGFFPNYKTVLFWSVTTYFLFALVFFSEDPAVRYFSPIFPFMAILSGNTFEKIIQRRKLLWVLAGLLVLQTAGVLGYVYKERKFTQGQKDAILFLKQNTPRDKRVLAPLPYLAIHSDVNVIWDRPRDVLKALYSEENNDGEVYEILAKYNVHYLVVPSARIYDDEKEIHHGGYGKNLLNRLGSCSFLEEKFRNKEMLIYEITK